MLLKYILLIVCIVTLLTTLVAIYKVRALRREITAHSNEIVYNQVVLLWMTDDYYQVAIWAEKMPGHILEYVKTRIAEDKFKDWEILLKLI